MPEGQSLTGGKIAERLEGDPLLKDFLTPFPNLLQTDDIAGSFQRMAESLGKTNFRGPIQFSIREGGKQRRWCLVSAGGGCRVSEDQVERPRLEILTDADSWMEVAKGKLSPLEAFALGKMRVRGDIKLARLLARRLQTKSQGVSEELEEGQVG